MSFLDLFKPSVRLRQLFRRVLEKLLDETHTGPDAPGNIADRVRIFNASNPTATRDEWTSFAIRIAENCYRQGFVRGYDWQSNDWQLVGDPTAQQEAEIQAHDWTIADTRPDYDLLLRQGFVPNDPLGNIDQEQRQAWFDQMRVLQGSGAPYAVVVAPEYGEVDRIEGVHLDLEEAYGQENDGKR